MSHPHTLFALLLILPLCLAACGDDDDGTEADRQGVAAVCVESADCNQDLNLVCLDSFKGGYCGLPDCMAHTDCPEGALCVTHDDGNNYCFRECVEKAECNANRPADAEANCSSSITYVTELADKPKACVPPSN